MPRRYGRNFNYPRRFGTRYFSTRKTPGFYRTAARWALAGPAKRLFGRFSRGGTRSQIKKIVRSIAEKKIHGAALSLTNGTVGEVLAAGVMALLTNIAVGTEVTQRIGDKVLGSSLVVRMLVKAPQAKAASAIPPISWGIYPEPAYYLRVIIFIWKDDSTPTLDDILDPVADIDVYHRNVLAHLDHDRKIKRKILMDEVYNLYNGSTNEVNQQSGTTGVPTEYSVGYSGGVHVPTMSKTLVFNLAKIRRGLNQVNYIGTSSTNPINGIYIYFTSNAASDITVFPPTPSNESTAWDIMINSRYTFTDM